MKLYGIETFCGPLKSQNWNVTVSGATNMTLNTMFWSFMSHQTYWLFRDQLTELIEGSYRTSLFMQSFWEKSKFWPHLTCILSSFLITTNKFFCSELQTRINCVMITCEKKYFWFSQVIFACRGLTIVKDYFPLDFDVIDTNGGLWSTGQSYKQLKRMTGTSDNIWESFVVWIAPIFFIIPTSTWKAVWTL